ncbi:hypothetical protein [Chondromyces apiculatus]|uniref:hypothetical protein n=1 Tax=Chondromyces apiculatus TaxID=51 RepID=UPI0005C5AD27|nr:hypothetical protein [Chondromyces apiculatus]
MANSPTLAATKKGRNTPGSVGGGPDHELKSGSVSRRCCFSEGKLSTGVSSSVTTADTSGLGTSRGATAEVTSADTIIEVF